MHLYLLFFMMAIISPSEFASPSHEGHQTFEVMQLKVNASLAEVKNVLLDIETYGELHPLIKSTMKLDSGQYLIKERPYRYNPMVVKYKAYITDSTATTVDFGFSKVLYFTPTFYYELSSDDDQSTMLKLTIQIDGGPKLGRQIMINKMIQAQAKLWTAFEQSLTFIEH